MCVCVCGCVLLELECAICDSNMRYIFSICAVAVASLRV
jgi:hypothetical protein